MRTAVPAHRTGRVNLDRANLEAALPGYTVTRLIAGGGFGLVFAGRHLSLDRPVAIKILLPRADGASTAQDTFAAEARLLERLAHPHIVRVHDYVERDGLSMIIMEYCGGGTLRRRVREAPTVVTAVGIALAVAAALDLAHRQQVIHRDIKPENVLFADDGTPKVSDFGIAKIVAFTGNPADTVIGTPAYMAPEQFTGTVLRPATDLYSLGIVLYELLSGRTPYAGRGRRHLPHPPAPVRTSAAVGRRLRAARDRGSRDASPRHRSGAPATHGRGLRRRPRLRHDPRVGSRLVGRLHRPPPPPRRDPRRGRPRQSTVCRRTSGPAGAFPRIARARRTGSQAGGVGRAGGANSTGRDGRAHRDRRAHTRCARGGAGSSSRRSAVCFHAGFPGTGGGSDAARPRAVAGAVGGRADAGRRTSRRPARRAGRSNTGSTARPE